MGLTAFQSDLRNGMGLEDALKKHNMSLNEALKTLPRVPQGKKRCNPENRNIFRRGKSWVIIKKYSNKTYQFGTYSTIEDARLIRDYMEENGWELLDVGLACALLGVKRLKRTKGV